MRTIVEIAYATKDEKGTHSGWTVIFKLTTGTIKIILWLAVWALTILFAFKFGTFCG